MRNQRSNSAGALEQPCIPFSTKKGACQVNTHRGSWWRLPIIALAVLLAVSLACGDSTEIAEPRVSTATPAPAETQALAEQPPATEEPVTAPSPTVEQTTPPTNTPLPTPAPTATVEPVSAYLGDVVGQYGYLIQALSVEDPTSPVFNDNYNCPLTTTRSTH
jgi:hypothetical protein